MSIMGNMIGSYSQIGRTFVLTDENGTELTGVCTEKEVIFDATAADIKIGKTAATDSGITEGENTVTYRTQVGYCLVLPGDQFSIPLSNYDQYDYTKLQCVITLFSSDYSAGATAHNITINDGVYSIETSQKISDITKNITTKSIDLNITNNTDNIYEISYFTYRNDTEE